MVELGKGIRCWHDCKTHKKLCRDLIAVEKTLQMITRWLEPVVIGGAKLIIVSKMFIKPVVRKTLQNTL